LWIPFAFQNLLLYYFFVAVSDLPTGFVDEELYKSIRKNRE